MSAFFIVCFVIVANVAASFGAPATPTATSTYRPPTTSTAFVTPPPDRRPCPRNPYCNGFHLPLVRQSELKGKRITCNTVQDIDQHCCLGSPFHYVCYNIRIDDKLLSVNKTNYVNSTDFQKLCEDLMGLYDKTLGSYTMITIAEGSGALIYGGRSTDNYGKWVKMEGTHHIKNLACEFIHEEGDPPEVDAYITTTPAPPTKKADMDKETEYDPSENNTIVMVKKKNKNKKRRGNSG